MNDCWPTRTVDKCTIRLAFNKLADFCSHEDISKALSTLSQKSATVAENDETTATVAEFGYSRTFLRQIVALFCDYVDMAISNRRCRAVSL